jgi:ATP-dependent Lhr-like helicase
VSSRARIVDHLSEHGASFYDELVDGTPVAHQVEKPWPGGSVRRGDLRQFRRIARTVDAVGKRSPSARARALPRDVGVEDAGRWALLKRREAPAGSRPVT